MSQKISIKDIARMADVSVATVSRVLNHKGRYSEETEKKIMKIVDESGYTSNMAARSLRSSSSKMIGLLIPDITNEFFSRIAYCCEIYLSNLGYSLMLCNTDNDPQKESRYINDLVSKNADGILAISFLKELPKSYTNNPVPTVVIDRMPQDHRHTPYIMTSEVSAAYNLTKYMIEKGSSHLVGLSTETIDDNPIRRGDGFVSCLKDHDLLYDIEKQYYELGLGASANSIEEAHDIISDLLDHGTEVDGIFCGSDRMALGASKAVRRHHLRIPEDVQIVGFDNSLYAKLCEPPITTLKRESRELSEKACQMLLEKINNPDKTIDSHIIHSEIIFRESTR